MVELGVFFGVLVGSVVTLVVVLLRRGNGPTRNADGLLTEQTRRVAAHQERTAFRAGVLDGTSPTLSDCYRP